MAQVGMAGVSAAMAYVTGPTPSEVPSKRIQDQQSSRPVKESEEADQDSDQGADVIFETSEPKKEASPRNEDNISRSENESNQVGEQIDISV